VKQAEETNSDIQRSTVGNTVTGINVGATNVWVKQDRQRKHKRNIEARSRNHCCRGKAISVTHSECVCSLIYPACKAHAHYYIVICGLSGRNLLNVKLCFDFLYNFCLQHFSF
jgi:hypothetical protein